jgi:hypothetical protein
MRPEGAAVTGVADAPYVALPPARWRDGEEAAPLIVAWHLNDPPRSAAAMAGALPLGGRGGVARLPGLADARQAAAAGRARRVHGARLPDAVLKAFEPQVTQAVSEFPAVLAELRARLPLTDGPIGLARDTDRRGSARRRRHNRVVPPFLGKARARFGRQASDDRKNSLCQVGCAATERSVPTPIRGARYPAAGSSKPSPRSTTSHTNQPWTRPTRTSSTPPPYSMALSRRWSVRTTRSRLRPGGRGPTTRRAYESKARTTCVCTRLSGRSPEGALKKLRGSN